MKFGRNVLRVKTHALTGDVNESMTSYFKMAVMTSAFRLLLVSSPGACGVIGSLYALQFLMHVHLYFL